MKTSQAMTDTRPSPWAVTLLVLSSGFAVVSIGLLSTGYGLT